MKRLLLVLIILIGINKAKAQTYVSGGIYANTTWTKAASPYIVTDTFVVYPGVKLTIEPGVTVKFEDTSRLEIREAEIDAIGTVTDSITFTSNATILKPGNWGGIYINNVNLDTLNFKYCNFKYATSAINKFLSQFGKLVVRNCRFMNCESGIYSSHPGLCLIDSSVFSDMTLKGMEIRGFNNYISNSSFLNCNIGINNLAPRAGGSINNCQFSYNQTALNLFYGPIQNCKITNNIQGIRGDLTGGNRMSNNLISDNSEYGILAFNDSIMNCKIHNNAIGIVAYGNSISKNTITNNAIGISISDYSNLTTISCNIICSNTSYDLEYFGSSTKNSSFPDNYFCTADSASIRSKIFDGYVDAKYGIIKFMPLDTTCYKTLGIIENKVTKQPNTKLYPNPFSQTATLEFENPQNKSHQLSVFNTIGQLVMTEANIKGSQVIVDRKELQSGLYFYQLRNEDGVIGSGKMLIE